MKRRSVVPAGLTGAFLTVLGTAGQAAAVPYYGVAPGARLNVRSGPGTTVSGPYGTSNIWDDISNGQYVSDAYVYTGSDGYVASRCA